MLTHEAQHVCAEGVQGRVGVLDGGREDQTAFGLSGDLGADHVGEIPHGFGAARARGGVGVVAEVGDLLQLLRDGEGVVEGAVLGEGLHVELWVGGG